MKKYLLLILCILTAFIYGCGNRQKEQLNYETYIIPYQLTEDDSFECIQVREMEDEQLQQKINESFMMVMPYMRGVWLPEADYTSYDHISYETTIHLQSSKYLSVEYHFETYAVNGTLLNSTRVGVTVDMETGEIVYLDDLVRLDEEFATTVKNCRILKHDAWGSMSAKKHTKDLYKYRWWCTNTSSLARMYEDYAKEHLYQKYQGQYFYLEEGYIVYDNSVYDNGANYNKIDISRLDDFLLVEKW